MGRGRGALRADPPALPAVLTGLRTPVSRRDALKLGLAAGGGSVYAGTCSDVVVGFDPRGPHPAA
ncbi:MAG: twin-arginine translocation signal domain-containing protein [Gemmatimonadota bacterium]